MALLNFRDVAQAARGPLRPGRLFRSAQPYQLTAAEAAQVQRSGIRTIIDLREPAEAVPPDWAPAEQLGLGVVRISLADQLLGDDPPAVFGPHPADGHQLLARFYSALLDRARPAVARVVRQVATGDPVLIHCAAGKDRTGTSVAVLLDLIGTEHDAIVSDYLLTQDAVPAILAQAAHARGIPELPLDAVPAGLSDAPLAAIRSLLTHLTAVGGARALLADQLSPAELDRAAAVLTD